jgi:hypothetical protein
VVGTTVWVVAENTPPHRGYSEQIGSVRIFRPRASREIELRIQSEQHLRDMYEVGRYADSDLINEILQHQYSFFTSVLEQTLPTIASLDLLEFLLAEYEKTAEIERLYQESDLDDHDMERWANLGPVVRRATKYLAERTVMLAPRESLEMPMENALEAIERAYIGAEELVRHYLLSDQTFMIFPDDTILEIHQEGSHHYWTLQLDNRCATMLQERTRLDTIQRDRFVPHPSFDLRVQEHDRLLGSAFEENLGISYVQALGVLRALIEGAELPTQGFPIPFVHRERTLELLSCQLGLPRPSIEQVLSGFLISRSSLTAEGRQVWKPKQEYRALRRGIFEVDHSTGTHWMFSKAMAKECAVQLVGGVVFKDLPPEWRSEQVNSRLDALSNKAGKWFEQVVLNCFEAVGAVAVGSQRNGIGRGSARILIPPTVGEIDYLGYSPTENLLVLAECKMVRGGFEPRYFRDEISEFTGGRDSYFAKFQRKVNWVRDNTNNICRAIGSVRRLDGALSPTHLATAIITLYPTIASCFASEAPCVTLTEVMAGYEEKGHWPCQDGIYPC